jgi:hypothetical protein
MKHAKGETQRGRFWRLERQRAPVQEKTVFTPVEDALLLALVRQFGRTHWINVASRMPPRTARQCRERWINYLNPELSQAPWTSGEDDILRSKYKEFGPKWVQIAEFLPRRSANSIKNRVAVLERRSRRTGQSAVVDKEDDPVARFFADVKVDVFEDELSYIFSAF